MEKIQVIYIAGQGRSGSTIIDRILGTLDGVASMAEVYRVLKDGMVGQKRCACGAGMNDCPFWSKIFSTLDPIEVERSLILQDAVDHSRYFWALWTGFQNRRFHQQLEDYKVFLQHFYEAMALQTGCRILVDSSKVPSRALILNEIPNIEVHVVHVVRDVRGIMYAWQSDKYDPASGQLMNKISPFRSLLAWLSRNVMCELLGQKIPYSRISYEAFAKHPKLVIQSLVERIKILDGQTVSFLGERSIILPINHTIGGNPDRFYGGEIQILPDRRWEKVLPYFSRIGALVLMFPLLIRYGSLRRQNNNTP